MHIFFLLWQSLKFHIKQVLKSLKKVLDFISKYLQEPWTVYCVIEIKQI